MSVDVTGENQSSAQNGSTEVHVNGISNGHHHYSSGGGGGGGGDGSGSSSSKHKSSSKDKHRDKDRDHKSSSSSSNHKSSSRDKEKHGSSSSSSSNKDKHRDKHRDRDEKHGSGSSSSSNHHRDKDKERSSDRDKHKSSSSSSSHHKSSSKHRDRSDKDRKEGSSSSTSSTKDKEKDRHHRKSSSSSSSSRDKDRHHHKSSSSSSSSKHKHSSSRSSSSSHDKANRQDGEFIKPEPVSQSNESYLQQNGFNENVMTTDIKQDINTIDYQSNDNSFNNGYKEGYEMKSDFKPEEHNFDVSQTSSCDYSMSQFKDDEPAFVIKAEASYSEDGIYKQEDEEEEDEENENENEEEEEEDEDEDIPLAMRKSKSNQFREDEDEEDVPLAKRKKPFDGDDEEDVPLLARKKPKKESRDKSKEKKKKRAKEEHEYDDYATEKPRKKSKKADVNVKTETVSSTKRVKKEKKEDEEEVWRWWEEEKRADGIKWTTLEHKGPVFAPPYIRLPKNVRFFYDGKAMELSEVTEEAATFYAKMLNHDYCTKQVFNDNFFKDFRRSMTSKEKEIIKDFKKCNFQEMHEYFLAESEKRKNATKEEKLAKKQENEALIKEYGVCVIDGHKEKIGNFRLEPPGLFRGRGEHPKMGMIKRRIQAEDVSINCGKESKTPQPPAGHRWKEVFHNNTVTWLASWVENIQGQVKYIMLNPSSKLKGEKDHIKYETARRLAQSIDKIRSTYRDEWKSKEMRVRQRAVALYFIDKLALRAGNEKDEDQADTVGCCSLRVEHVSLHKELNGKENVVIFDFLGKDSIRYYNEVQVEKRVFKNLELFMENKKKGDDLFDRLNTQVLNEHLKELMEGLTAKVFRTYNASYTLQNQLDLLTKEDMTVPEKLLAYNRANRAVAILCNHQRSVPKSHEKSMENLKEKIRQKREALDECEADYYDIKKAAKRGSVKEKLMADKKGKQLERLKEQLKKLELQETDRDENKTIALGTSKLNYLDPRISVAWCKKFGVPIEKIFNKTQRNKFMWAIHMADENYRF